MGIFKPRNSCQSALCKNMIPYSWAAEVIADRFGHFSFLSHFKSLA